jgi:hypothetical protein
MHNGEAISACPSASFISEIPDNIPMKLGIGERGIYYIKILANLILVHIDQTNPV